MGPRARTGVTAVAGGFAVILGTVHAAPSGARPVPDEDTSNCAFVDDSNYEAYAGGAEQAGTVPAKGEISAFNCLERVGSRTTMHYGWQTAGRLQVGVFNFSLIDCSTGKRLEDTVRVMSYPRGSTTPSGSGTASFTLPADKRYRTYLYGAGTYRRNQAAGPGQSVGGRFNNHEEPKFTAKSVCE
ncbi:MAG: hypothetical protein ACT4P1_08825 [Sporichthyaceae bacterium]